MILVIDIGNTKIKLGFFKNKKLTKEESFITFDDFKKKIHLFVIAKFKPDADIHYSEICKQFINK